MHERDSVAAAPEFKSTVDSFQNEEGFAARDETRISLSVPFKLYIFAAAFRLTFSRERETVHTYSGKHKQQRWITEKDRFEKRQKKPFISLAYSFLSAAFLAHNALGAALQMVTGELVQSLCRNRSWGGGGGSAPTNPSSSCSQCTPRRGAEAEPPPPPAHLAGFTLRPKCDTSSLRWERMSSVQRNTLGANKYVSALRHNR